MLEKRFRVKADVPDSSVKEYLTLATEVTRPMLWKYGEEVWVGAEAPITKIDERHFPRHLEHDNKYDRER
jgi:hypothetical protein